MKKLMILVLTTLVLGCNKSDVTSIKEKQLNEYETFKRAAGINDDNLAIQKFFEQKNKETGSKILYYSFGLDKKQDTINAYLPNNSIQKKAFSSKKAEPSAEDWKNFYTYDASAMLDGLSSTTPSYDANVKWTVLTNRAGLWNVFSEETITLKKYGTWSKTYIHAIAHLGSYIKGTGFIPLPVSWSENLVDIYPTADNLTYETRNCIVRVLGSVSMGWSWTTGNYCVITAKEY
ncbi:hypothetical protein [Sphingobacterium ginsenosidimutans]|uniref:Lipoprotein n=1 Tax=Sphingobacterium ginsenosidimutans TaxID=687845 RepID=A0ABP8AA73_9SPHI